jgi:predicted dehydrogenase
VKRIGMGIVGAGFVGPHHVDAVRRLGYVDVIAVAGSSQASADKKAEALGARRGYGSYEALLADPDVEVVYNPLPNHLHLPWTVKAAEAGKHVLCEKPIGLDADECRKLIEVRDRTGVRIQEAFMVRTHPQWLRTRELVQGGRIGELKAIHGHFSYHLTDANNVRNVAEWGGGGLLDIGCYPITTSRFVTGLEPARVAAVIERDPSTGIDRLGTAILDYEGIQCCFQYGTQMVPRQTMQFFGTKARLVVEVGFNAPNDVPCRLSLYDAQGLGDVLAESIEIPTCDQYGIMGDAFAASIQDGTPQPVPLEDSLANMRVIDAVFRAGKNSTWEQP